MYLYSRYFFNQNTIFTYLKFYLIFEMENVHHRYLEERKQSAEVKKARLRNLVPPPLEPEIGSNLLNLHIYSNFLPFLSIGNVTIFPNFMILLKFFPVP